jgi:hypothetical protein
MKITQNLCRVIAQVGFGLGTSIMQVSCVALVLAIFDFITVLGALLAGRQ